MKNLLFSFISLIGTYSVFAQHLYKIALNKLKNDVLPVKMTLSKAPQTDQVTYSFPPTPLNKSYKILIYNIL